MPIDESMPSLVSSSSTLTHSPGIKWPDPLRARATGEYVSGGVPPMFQMLAPAGSVVREPERLSD